MISRAALPPLRAPPRCKSGRYNADWSSALRWLAHSSPQSASSASVVWSLDKIGRIKGKHGLGKAEKVQR